jgi:hypothetical protein
MIKFVGLAIAASAILMAGCSKDETAWVVVELIRPDGTKAQMVFNNPSVPDMTLAECESSLEGAVPTLKEGIESKPETRGSQWVSAKCVMSIGDPIEPKS